MMVWSKESRHTRGYGAAWEQTRKVVIARAKGLCEKCAEAGRVAMGRDVDHKVPKAEAKRLRWSEAKMDHPSNLWYLCKPCHDAKTAEETGRAYRPKVATGLDGWPDENVTSRIKTR